MCSEGQSSLWPSVRNKGELREQQIYALYCTDANTLDRRGDDNCLVLHSTCFQPQVTKGVCAPQEALLCSLISPQEIVRGNPLD